MSKQTNITELDFQQVIRRSFDDVNDRLRTDTNITIDGSGGLDVIISDLNDSVAIGDGNGNLVGVTEIDGEKTLNVNVKSPVSQMVSGVSYDEMIFSYPSTTQDQIDYKLMNVLKATILITYTDTTKSILSSVKRTV